MSAVLWHKIRLQLNPFLPSLSGWPCWSEFVDACGESTSTSVETDRSPRKGCECYSHADVSAVRFQATNAIRLENPWLLGTTILGNPHIYIYIMNIPFLDTASACFVYHCFTYFRAATSHEQSFVWRSKGPTPLIPSSDQGRSSDFRQTPPKLNSEFTPEKVYMVGRYVFPKRDGQLTGTICLCKKYNHLQTAPWEGDR